MSCKYLQGFIDSISGWLLFVTMVWMVAVRKTKLMLGGQRSFSWHIKVLFHTCTVVYDLSLQPLCGKWSPTRFACCFSKRLFKWMIYKLKALLISSFIHLQRSRRYSMYCHWCLHTKPCTDVRGPDLGCDPQEPNLIWKETEESSAFKRAIVPHS